MTLTEFLLARIGEDEVEAQAVVLLPRGMQWWRDNPDSPFDPARVLAECKAKRRIVEFLRPDQAMPVDSGRFVSAGVLTLLALPYADHPDYREEWSAGPPTESTSFYIGPPSTHPDKPCA